MDLRLLGEMPTVISAMTPFPYFVDVGDPALKIEELMDEHNIHHIPVQENGTIVGIVSERDLHRLVHRALPEVDKRRIRAKQILVEAPYVVEVEMPLNAVVVEMASRRIGSAIVVKRGKLAGILSTTDVCRVLAEILASYFPNDKGGDAA
jgi:acetoin utilization protein AcuB